MAKTKVVQKNANTHCSETKSQETGQESVGSPKREFIRPFLIIFHFEMQKN